MKYIVKILMVIATAAILAFLTACEPIGYSIEQEEKLSAATIRGNIHTMVPMGGNLYVQNGLIYTKAFDGTGDWKEMTRPTNARIVALASDDACLYAKDSDNNIWAAPNGSGWTKVHSGAGEVFLFDNGVFDAAGGSTGDTTGRVAYFRAGNDVKKLDKTTDTASITPVSGNGAGANTKNCVSISGTDYFTDKSIVATFGNNIFAVESEARLETSACKTIVYMDTTAGSPTWTAAGTTKHAVTSMAMSSDGKLLIGTLQNYEIWMLNSSKPDSGAAASETAASIGSHSILGIWEYAGIRYASIYNLKVSNYNGLWYRKANGKWDKA